MEKTKETLWTKEFVIVSFINFLVTLVFYLLMVTIAKYAVNEFHVSASTAGLVSSIFIIGALLGRLGGGRIISQLGSKKTLLYGVIAFLMTTFLYFIAVNITLLFIVRLMQGIAAGLVGTVTGTIIAQIVPAHRRGEGIGYFSLSLIIATAIGPYFGLLLLQKFGGFDVIFMINATLSIIVVGMFFLIKFPDYLTKMAGSSQTAQQEHTGFLSKFIESRAVPISFVALFVGFAYSGVLSFMSLYTVEIDLEKIGGYFFLIYAVVVILTRPVTGKLLDARGANVVIYPCLLIFAIGMYLFSSAAASIVFIVAAILIGIGYGNFTSVAQAVAVKEVPHERMGLATSTFYIFYDFGLGFGPYLLGMLVPFIGYRAIFGWMVAVIAISIVVYYFLCGKKESRKVLVNQ